MTTPQQQPPYSTKSTPQGAGTHILAEFWQCQCAVTLLCHTQPLQQQLCQAVQQAGLTLVGHTAYEFSPLTQGEHKPTTQASNQQSHQQTSGVTISLLLAESHLCLHTWGELASVTLDIYVCNVLQNNTSKAHALLATCQQLLQPGNQQIHTVKRYHFPIQRD